MYFAESAENTVDYDLSNVLIKRGQEAETDAPVEELEEAAPAKEVDLEEYEDSAGEKIKEALNEIWEQYADEEAIGEWLETTEAAFTEMSERQQQEEAELAE